MGKIAVHLHLFYWEQLDDLLVRLQNLAGYPYDLFVTMVDDNAEAKQKILTFKSDAKIWIVPNLGYDVGPFIDFLHKINLDEYDYIIKIHTKNNKTGCDTLLNHRYISRKYWFQLLVDALIGSKNIFNKNICAFKNDKKLGMIGSKYCITSGYKNVIKVKDEVVEIMHGFGLREFLPITFVAGTMFLVRSSLLQKIRDRYTIDDFAKTDGQIKDGTLAHTLERVFGCLVIAQGYKIQGFDENKDFECKSIFLSVRRFLFQSKITQKGYLLIKICKIPVYHRKTTQGIKHDKI